MITYLVLYILAFIMFIIGSTVINTSSPRSLSWWRVSFFCTCVIVALTAIITAEISTPLSL